MSGQLYTYRIIIREVKIIMFREAYTRDFFLRKSSLSGTSSYNWNTGEMSLIPLCGRSMATPSLFVTSGTEESCAYMIIYHGNCDRFATVVFVSKKLKSKETRR